MRIIIKSRQIELDQDLKKYALDRLNRLIKLIVEPAIVELNFEDERGGLKQGQDKKVQLNLIQVDRSEPIHASRLSDSFKASFDLALDRLERQLRRDHSKAIKRSSPSLRNLFDRV